MNTPLVVAHYADLPLQAAKAVLFFRVAISKYCVLTLIAVLLYALIGAPYKLEKRSPWSSLLCQKSF